MFKSDYRIVQPSPTPAFVRIGITSKTESKVLELYLQISISTSTQILQFPLWLDTKQETNIRLRVSNPLTRRSKTRSRTLLTAIFLTGPLLLPTVRTDVNVL